MNERTIESISRKVAKRFPETAGQRPRVTQQKSNAQSNFLLTYSGKGQGPGGKTLRRNVRVVANERGKILKVSTSK